MSHLRTLLAALALFGALIPVVAHGTAPGPAKVAAAQAATTASDRERAAAASAKSDLQARLGKLMAQAPRASGAWVFDATAAETIFRQRSGRSLIAASNIKLLTTATALARFGGDEKLKVKVRSRGGRRKAVMVEVRKLIGWINIPSDNELAEGLLRALGARFREKRTTKAGVKVVREHMASIGIDDFEQADGSGLSRSNKISAGKLGKLLEAMRTAPESRSWRSSLPLAGRQGTLRRRMRGTAAAGRCRAKTGTLHDVSTLSGYCFHDGQKMVFSILMNRVRSLGAAQKIQDKMVAAIAAY